MSRTETVHIKMEICDKQIRDFHRQQTEGMDSYDLSDYEFDNNVFLKNGVWWEIVHKEEFYEYGFTKIISKDNSSVEFITQFYNGGASIYDIIDGVLKNETI